jgi:hypothetical protein
MAKGLKKTPHYNTVVQRAAAGRGTSSTSLMPYPTYDFEFDLDSIQGNEAAAASVLASFQGTFMASGGQGGWFLFTDPQDDTVAYGTSCMLNVTAGAANPMGQTGDGSSTQFQLGRLVGGIGIDVIQNLNGSAAVKVNGTLTSVSVASTGVVTFSSAPADGSTLQWAGNFYHLCRFAEDSYNGTRTFTTNSGTDMWDVSNVKFSSEFI